MPKENRLYLGFIISLLLSFLFIFAILAIGHLMGFFYTFLLLTQMSFARTKIHSNRFWIVFLELFVLFHAVIVALIQNRKKVRNKAEVNS